MPSSGVQTCADRKSTRLNSSHGSISYAVFCLKKKNNHIPVRPFLTDTVRYFKDPGLASGQAPRYWYNPGAFQRNLRVDFFFFNDTATTEIYTLSLHDALPI